MTSVYPTEEKLNAPPTYEQATYYPQVPPTSSSTYNMYSTSATVFQPQAPTMGMYSTSPTVFQPQAPPMGMYGTPGMGMPPPVGTHMLITAQSILYGDIPILCTCPHCQQSIATRVERTTGLVPWLVCGAILVFGGWLGCCLIPFCIDSLKDTEHYCPNCSVLLGTRRRM